jgi:cytochrome c oxidase subunit I+III
MATIISGVLALGFIIVWLWTGTALIPEKPEKDVGLGLTLPLYQSGPNSVGWWAMFITMTGDFTAFASLVFGYFFYWTIHTDFPPPNAAMQTLPWFGTALAVLAASWILTVLARFWNRRGRPKALQAALAVAALLALAGGGALVVAPLAEGLDPTAHVYPATVWVLVLWTGVHVAVGVLMQLYCIARSLAGKLSPEHDIDIFNVALFWHFLVLTVALTVAVLGLFPLVA